MVDPYAWLANRDDTEVITHLESENQWHDSVMAPLEPLATELFDELKARIQETDMSVPVRDGAWWYYGRTVEGLEYGISARKPAGPDDADAPADDAPESIILDFNAEAARLGATDYFSVGTLNITLDDRTLAWSTDTTGAEEYTLRFRDLASGIDLTDQIEGVSAGSVWAGDNEHLFYLREDEAKRPFQVWRHKLGTPVENDVLIRTEPDEHFWMSVGMSRDEELVYVDLSSKTTTEVWMLEAGDPEGTWRCIEPREPGHEYSVSKHQDRFFITTNSDDSPNAKLMVAPVSDPGRANWRTVVPHRADVRFDGAEAFADHLVLHERVDAISRIRIRRLADGEEHFIVQPEEISSVNTGSNPTFDTSTITYHYVSMVTPDTIFAYDLDTHERRLLKQQAVLGGYDASDYVTERQWAMSHDGARVPMSVVRRRDTQPGPETPTVLYGYGAYEACMDPGFSWSRLSLLDRGFVFAIAHVRGGGELGRGWYDSGKLLDKPNSFEDFLACARHLSDTEQSSPERICLRGGSAGGLLVGSTVSLDPAAVGAVVAEVPFVDALNTILDPELPLTVIEWEEWGNPLDSPEIYATMAAYSPYENVRPDDWPPMYVTGGLNDSRVSYWEPAKWVAALREAGMADTDLLLRTEMGAGHSGPSGRYESWKEEARTLAWIIATIAPEQLGPGVGLGERDRGNPGTDSDEAPTSVTGWIDTANGA